MTETCSICGATYIGGHCANCGWLAALDSEKPRPALQRRDGARRNTTNRLIGVAPLVKVPDTARHLHVDDSPAPVLTVPDWVDVEELTAAIKAALTAAIKAALAGGPLPDNTDPFVAVAAAAYLTGVKDGRQEVA